MKLKPCPLCGSPAKIFYGSEKRWVICTDISLRRSFCLLAGSLLEIKSDLWNRLPRREPLQKQKDAMVKAVIHYCDVVGVDRKSRLYDSVCEYQAAKRKDKS